MQHQHPLSTFQHTHFQPHFNMCSSRYVGRFSSRLPLYSNMSQYKDSRLQQQQLPEKHVQKDSGLSFSILSRHPPSPCRTLHSLTHKTLLRFSAVRSSMQTYSSPPSGPSPNSRDAFAPPQSFPKLNMQKAPVARPRASKKVGPGPSGGARGEKRVRIALSRFRR